jgi:hypothetical protein
VGLRRAADGSIQAMGSVVGDVDQIQDVRAGTGGTVDLQVSNVSDSDDAGIVKQIIQTRSYRWTGNGFGQTGGPTSFTVSRPELTATLSDLVYGPAFNGTRTGTLTVSVHNGGTTKVSDASIAFELAVARTVTPSCEWLPLDVPWAGLCTLPSIAPGATGTLSLTLNTTDAAMTTYKGMSIDQIGGMVVQIRIGGLALTVQPKWGGLVIR